MLNSYKTIPLFVLSLSVALITHNGHASDACEHWLSEEFFASASLSTVNDCVAQGVNIQTRTDLGESVLHLAAGHTSDPEVIRRLVDLGVNPTLRRGDGLTPLHVAARYNPSPDVIVALILSGADVNEVYDAGDRGWRDMLPFGLGRPDGSPPLMLAVNNPNAYHILSTLLSVGADPNGLDNRGRSALHHLAGGDGHFDLIALLIAAGATVNQRDQEHWTPLHLAATRNRNARVTHLLIEHGADPDGQSRVGSTPLHQAAGYNDPAIFKIILDASQQPCEADNDGRTALGLAEANPSIRQAPDYWALHDLCFMDNT